jgi:phosphate transport system permease protein
MSTAPTAVRPAGLSLKRARPRYGEKAIVGGLALCAFVSVATTVGIVFSLLEPTIEFFGEVSPKEFFTGTEWSPLFANPKFGVLPLLSGTLLTTGVALLV